MLLGYGRAYGYVDAYVWTACGYWHECCVPWNVTLFENELPSHASVHASSLPSLAGARLPWVSEVGEARLSRVDLLLPYNSLVRLYVKWVCLQAPLRTEASETRPDAAVTSPIAFSTRLCLHHDLPVRLICITAILCLVLVCLSFLPSVPINPRGVRSTGTCTDRIADTTLVGFARRESKIRFAEAASPRAPSILSTSTLHLRRSGGAAGASHSSLDPFPQT